MPSLLARMTLTSMLASFRPRLLVILNAFILVAKDGTISAMSHRIPEVLLQLLARSSPEWNTCLGGFYPYQFRAFCGLSLGKNEFEIIHLIIRSVWSSCLEKW